MPSRRVAGWIFGLAALGLAPTCVVFVDETELVLVQRFGKIVAVYDRAEDKGPHAKWPWPVESVLRFDRRLRLFDPPGRELFTRDRKNLIVETYVAWRIPEGPGGATPGLLTDYSDRPVVRFYRSLGQPEIAESRLASRLQAIITSRLGQLDLSQLIAAQNSEAGPGDDQPLSRLSEELKAELIRRKDESGSLPEQHGIEIVDVRIKRLNLPSGNLQAVYERMRSERQKIAERYRSAGQAESRVIRSQAERRATEILAQANAEAERIKAVGEADALRTLNAAHAEDPEFYELLQALEAYKQILGEQTTLVLSASNRLWKLLTDGPPAAADKNEQSPETKP
jgi:membrane protease subunit HflC